MPLGSLFKALPFRHRFRRALPAPDAVRIAVIGLGRMGQYHVKRLAATPKARLAAVVDVDRHKAETTARPWGVAAQTGPLDLLGSVDAVVIATPTATHFETARPLLEAGISCLIEKPIASTAEEAEALISMAERSGAVLQVGHIERFNPAVREASRLIDHPQFIEVSRLGPYDPRVAEIGVVMDLMIHDLDIVQFLVNRPVERVEAFGAKVLSHHEDIAKVRLIFAGGCVADLSASRISLERYRRIRIFQKNAYLSLDYAAPHLKVYRKKKDPVRSLRDIAIQAPALSRQDPLTAELDHFLDCVQKRSRPLVSGQEGLSALQLAKRVLENLRIHVD